MSDVTQTNSSDWWNHEFGPVAFHLSDNPVLALDLARSSTGRTNTLAIANSMNQQGGEQDYTDENNQFS